MIKNKTILASVLGVAFLFGLLGPAVSHAQAQDGTEAGNICVAGEERKEIARDRIQVAADFMKAKQQTFSETTELQRGRASEAVDRTKVRYSEWTSEQVDLLLAAAETPEQESAVLEFKAAVELLIEQVSTENRELNDVFHDEMSALAEEKMDRILGDIDDFKNEITAAYDQAGADCRAGVDKDTALAELETRLKTAQADFIADKAAFQVRPDLEALLTAHEADQAALRSGFAEDIRAEGDILSEKWSGISGG